MFPMYPYGALIILEKRPIRNCLYVCMYVVMSLSHLFIHSNIEANYADKRKKRIIPLKYENHDPTEWLGLLIGSLKYHDVRNDEALENSFDALVKDIKREPLTAASSGKGMYIIR